MSPRRHHNVWRTLPHTVTQWRRYFDDLLDNPHPPVKGVPARKPFKNVKMSVRIERAEIRRGLALDRARVDEWFASFERDGDAEVTEL